MNNELLLMTKGEVPFPEAQITIHQPTLSEIGLIGEEHFFAGCQFINLSKDSFNLAVKNGLEDKSEFEIFMSVMCSKEKVEYRGAVLEVFSLLFPGYQVKFSDSGILLANDNFSTRITEENFNIFQNIINEIFELKDFSSSSGDYNPIDSRAKRIADKLRKRKEKIAHNSDNKKAAILSRYISILTVGEKKDMNTFQNYTVFQLKDEFKRFQLEQAFNMYKEAKMAGAKDLDEVDNWMDDIHP